ncbi:uncharacterized protein LOC124297051 [Neodiprion virginianus]|uniref:uncharacterized protein LOC124297051 n=1 Tax=Neodiprion virginianus TaxID=2961670 RepID=UPI001EE6FAC4|nr:uncharacterized protein LOC124297051 [Neodiprion virginianus]
MIYPSSHQAPTMSSARKISPRPQHRSGKSAPTPNSPSPSKGRRTLDRNGGAERCRGRCRVQWSEKHVKEGLVLVQESQLARVVKTGPISEHYEIDPKPFASGQWAKVYRCRSRSTGIVYAAKYSSRNRFNADCSAELRHEIALLSLCSQSPRVVRLHDVYETPKEIILVMEFAPGGDLQTLIDGDLVPLEGDVVHFVRQLVEGLAYLHERNIAHLDIKPQNLVMMGAFPECDVKLCDFEISRVVLEGTEVREILGTPDYVAPEILHYEPITLAADMWSLGVTTYVLLTGFSPFGGDTDQETFQNISLGEVDFPEELFEDVSSQAKDFVARLLVPDPRARMNAKQCLRHDWLRGAPTQASPHLRRYLSKSREVLLERVVSRENLRRATLLSQARSHANLSEGNCKGIQGLGGNLSQSEMCLQSYGMTGSQISLPGSEDGVISPSDSQVSLESTYQNAEFALSQSCLLNKEQTQGLLSQAQSKSHANLSHGPSKGILSRMRNLSETQSQFCLLNMAKNIPRHVMNPLFSRSRDKLYGLKSLSKSQGVLDIYRSLECLKTRKNQRARTEDMLPVFKQLSADIAASNASLGSADWSLDSGHTSDSLYQTGGDEVKTDGNRNDAKVNLGASEDPVKTNSSHPNGQNSNGAVSPEDDKPEVERSLGNGRVCSTQKPESGYGKSLTIESLVGATKNPSYDSEGNLDSLQSVESIESVESDTLTEDSDETPNRLSVKQPSKRQNSDISSHSNNSGNSDEKDDHSESENDEPKYTVAQLVSAFNKHQEVASKTSLEAIMTEKRINEVNFPTGPKALRLFIPDINITESTIVRRKTSYKPRKNWEELRKMNERNEGVTKRNFDDSGNEDEDDDDDKTASDHASAVDNESVHIFESSANVTSDTRRSNESSVSAVNCEDSNAVDRVKIVIEIGGIEDAATSLEDRENVKIDEKYKQCVDGVALLGKAADHQTSGGKVRKERPAKAETTNQNRTTTKSHNERVANYIFADVATCKKEDKIEPLTRMKKTSGKEDGRPTPKVDNTVNLKDILQRVDNSQTSPKENLENLRKRTSIAKIILNDNLTLDEDANNNGGGSPSIQRAKSEPPLIVTQDNRKMQLDIPPSFVRSASLSSESSCLTPSSVQSDIGMSWEDVRVNKSQIQSPTGVGSMGLESKNLQRRIPGWEISGGDGSHKGQLQSCNDAKGGSTVSLEEKKIWGKVCTGSYTRAMEKFNGKNPPELGGKKSSPNSLVASHDQAEKTRRKSSPAMPQFVNP